MDAWPVGGAPTVRRRPHSATRFVEQRERDGLPSLRAQQSIAAIAPFAIVAGKAIITTHSDSAARALHQAPLRRLNATD